MFDKHTKDYIELCYQELLETQNPSIQKDLKLVKKQLSKREQEMFLKRVLCVHLSDFLLRDDAESDFDEMFVEMFHEVSSQLKARDKSIVIKVELEGQENNIYRIMEIPYFISLADMAYLVLGSLEADANHLFMITCRQDRFVSPADPGGFIDTYADEYMLSHLNLRKNSRLELLYDFGDDYNIIIRVLEIKKKRNFTIDDSQVLEGNGYGIWEDEHYALDLYYDNKQDFYKFIEENGFESEWYPLDEEFDLDVNNEMLIENFYILKEAYER